jgi:hypothetical protein
VPDHLLLAPTLIGAGDPTWVTTTGAVAAAAAAVIALVAIWAQFRALTRQLRSANYQQIVSAFDDFSKLLVDRPELVDYIYHGKPVPQADRDLQHRIDWAIGIRFGWFESVVVQRQEYQLLSPDIADHWMHILSTELDAPAMRTHWEKSASYYHPTLRAQVQQILATKIAQQRPRVTS